jgi:hypothetical protein
MNYNSRYKAIEELITAFKINKKVYVEKLEEEKNKLVKRGSNDKELKQKACVIVKFFDMKFKSKKQNLVQSFFVQHRNWNAKNEGLKWLRDIKTKSSHPVKIEFIPEIFIALPEADEVSNAL